MRRATGVALLAGVLAWMPGCVAVVAGAAAAGTMKYVSNESARTYPADLRAAWQASLEALREVGYPIDPAVPYGKDGGSLDIEDVKLQVRAGETSGSRVWVRVGTFDTEKNRAKAARILDAIQRRLGS